MVIVRHCKLAEKDHEESLRQYAHVHHIKGNVICVAGAWVLLPFATEMGLIAHEVGHLLIGDTEHSEVEADKTANKFFRITIRYRHTVHGNDLQYLLYDDALRVYNWSLDNMKFTGRLFG